jgi:hypothetical protein
VAFLPAKAFDLCHGNALYPYLGQGGANIVEFEGFNDGDEHFHAGIPYFVQTCSLAAVK